MLLRRLHPGIAYRDCGHCLQFIYDEQGRVETDAEGNPRKRGRRSPAPCRLPHVGCPKGTPENPRTLSARNEEFYRAYRLAKLTGRWPDDPLFLDIAVEVAEAEDLIDRAEQLKSAQAAAHAGSLAALSAMHGV